MNSKENKGFSYTYSASEQEEIKRIREKYTPQRENKMERLRRLDRAVTSRAQIASLTAGIIGVLTLGFGMSLFMSTLGASLGLETKLSLVLGIPIGIVGAAIASAAYTIYNFVIKRERKRVASEIIFLSDELLK